MKISPDKKPRGIALFIVLISIAVLSGMAFIFASQMKVETKLAANSNNETEMEWTGRSGVEYARWVLGLELTTPGPGQRFDSLDQKWAGGQTETNDTLAGISMTDIPIGLNGMIKSVKIVDNERKLNINTLAFDQAMMNRVFTQIGTDASEIPGLISSIQDWIDSDDETREGGAESAYYQSQAIPYNAKNAPIDDLTELLMIKGISGDVYWGPNSSNHPPGYFQAKAPVNRNGPLPTTLIQVGLADVFTPMSNGKLNILTASETELQFLPLVDASIASQIVKLRQETGENGFLPYSSPSDLLVNTSLGREGAGMAANYCTFRSSMFEVQVEVQVGQSPPRVYYALLQRNSPRDIPILSMHWAGKRSSTR